MNKQSKELRKAFLFFIAAILLLAVFARIGFIFLDHTGNLSYDYIAASSGPIMDQLLTVFTGGQLYGVAVIVSLAIMTYAGGSVIILNHNTQAEEEFKPMVVFLHGLLLTLIVLVTAAIVGTKLLSAVQIASMKTKLNSDLGKTLMSGMFLASLSATFTSACAGIHVIYKKNHLISLIVSVCLWGAIVSIVGSLIFASFAQPVLQGYKVAGWLLLSVVLHMVYAYIIPKIIVAKK